MVVYTQKKTAIISLHSIDRFVPISKTECVYGAVQAKRLSIIQANLRIQTVLKTPW